MIQCVTARKAQRILQLMSLIPWDSVSQATLKFLATRPLSLKPWGSSFWLNIKSETYQAVDVKLNLFLFCSDELRYSVSSLTGVRPPFAFKVYGTSMLRKKDNIP